MATVQTVKCTAPGQADLHVPEPLLAAYGIDPATFASLTPEQQIEAVGGLFDNLPVITWAISHAGDVKVALGYIQTLTGSGDLSTKLAALQALLTLLEKDIADYPGNSKPSPTPTPTPSPIGPPVSQSLVACKAQLESLGDGTVISGVLADIVAALQNPMFQAALQLAIGIFLKTA